MRTGTSVVHLTHRYPAKTSNLNHPSLKERGRGEVKNAQTPNLNHPSLKERGRG